MFVNPKFSYLSPIHLHNLKILFGQVTDKDSEPTYSITIEDDNEEKNSLTMEIPSKIFSEINATCRGNIAIAEYLLAHLFKLPPPPHRMSELPENTDEFKNSYIVIEATAQEKENLVFFINENGKPQHLNKDDMLQKIEIHKRLYNAWEAEQKFFSTEHRLDNGNIQITCSLNSESGSIPGKFLLKIAGSEISQIDLYILRQNEIGKEIYNCLNNDKLSPLEKITQVRDFLVEERKKNPFARSTSNYGKAVEIINEQLAVSNPWKFYPTNGPEAYGDSLIAQVKSLCH